MLATLSFLIVCHLGSGSRPPRNEAERALLYQQLQDIVEAPELAMDDNTSSKFLVAEDLEVRELHVRTRPRPDAQVAQAA